MVMYVFAGQGVAGLVLLWFSVRHLSRSPWMVHVWYPQPRPELRPPVWRAEVEVIPSPRPPIEAPEDPWKG